MRIISIDVGIKNLAYCILTIEPNTSSLKEESNHIEKWGVVDLSTKLSQPPQELNKILCSCFTMTKGTKKTPSIQKQCSSIAKWKKDNVYYCAKHAKNTAYIIPTSQLKPSYLKKQNISYLKQLLDKYCIALYSDKNTKTELLSLLDTHIQNNILESIISSLSNQSSAKNVNASTLDLVTIGKNMKIHFDKLFNEELKPIDRIVIENQISPIANRMKTIQGMIAQYFIMNTQNNDLIIDFCNSANKLKLAPSSQPIVEYKQRKALGIQLVSMYLTDANWLSFFNEYGNKKDDLADCYLQGIWYIKNKL